MNDPVNHPSHYCKPGQLECIEQMEIIFGEKAVMDFCLLNAYKYIERCESKGNFKQDLEKAIWYLKKLASYISDEDKLKSYIKLCYSETCKTNMYLFSAQIELCRIHMLHLLTAQDDVIMRIGLAIGYLNQAIENGAKGESVEA